MKIRPTETQVQGKAAPWDEEIETLWETHVEPRFEDGETCASANFYRPRRYVDEYNTGSCEIGFTYIVQPGYRVCYWQEKVLDVPLGTPTGREDGRHHG